MLSKPGKKRGCQAPCNRTFTALNVDVHIYNPCHNCAKAIEHGVWSSHERALMKDLGCTRLRTMPPLVNVNSINSEQFGRDGKAMRTAGYDPNTVGVGRRPQPRSLTRPRGGGTGRVTAAPNDCGLQLSLSLRSGDTPSYRVALGRSSIVGSMSNLNPLALQRLGRDATLGILGAAALFAPDDTEGASMTDFSAIVKKISKAVVCEKDPATRWSLQESVEWDTNTAAAMAAGQHTALNAQLPTMGGAPGAPRAPITQGGVLYRQRRQNQWTPFGNNATYLTCIRRW